MVEVEEIWLSIPLQLKAFRVRFRVTCQTRQDSDLTRVPHTHKSNTPTIMGSGSSSRSSLSSRHLDAYIDPKARTDAGVSVKTAEIQECRLFHGAFSFLLTLGATIAAPTSDSLMHHWVVIELMNGEVYVAQVTSGYAMLQKVSKGDGHGKWHARQAGLKGAGRDEANVSTYRGPIYPGHTLSRVIRFIEKEYDLYYHVLNHNCQDFARQLMNKIQF